MIIEKEFKKLRSFVKGSKLYFNPAYYPSNKSDLLDLSPLLVDKTLVYLTENNFSSSDLSKIQSFNEEGFTVPVSISKNKLPSEIQTGKEILRDKLLDEALFDKNYKYGVEEDLSDEELAVFFENAGWNGVELNSFAFSSNWDLIFMQLFHAPMYASSNFGPIFDYKLNRLGKDIYQPSRIQNFAEVSNFLTEINVVVPSKLTIDQIKEFRKDKTAIQFRNWLDNKLINVEEESGPVKVKSLVQEFNKLSKTYEK